MALNDLTAAEPGNLLRVQTRRIPCAAMHGTPSFMINNVRRAILRRMSPALPDSVNSIGCRGTALISAVVTGQIDVRGLGETEAA